MHDVKWYNLTIVYRRLPSTRNSRPTAVIIADRHRDGRQWVNFLESVHSLLEGIGYSDLSVEIVDPFARFGKSG